MGRLADYQVGRKPQTDLQLLDSSLQLFHITSNNDDIRASPRQKLRSGKPKALGASSYDTGLFDSERQRKTKKR